MKVTHKMIQEDVNNVIHILKNKDMEIPSAWQCMRPGLFILMGIGLWAIAVAWDRLGSPNSLTRNFAVDSVYFSLFIGVFIFIGSFLSCSQYFSLPEEIRRSSIMLKIIRRKALVYLVVWVVFNITMGVRTVVYMYDPAFTSTVYLLASLIVGVIAFSVDMGRYNFSLFSSAIAAWRKGNSLRE